MTYEISRYAHRNIFFAANQPPYFCARCSREIIEYEGSGGNVLVVHHSDENHDNNELTNLQPMHRSCHVSHHNAGKSKKPEAVAKQAAALRGRKLPDAHRAAIAAGHVGLTHTAITIEKIRASNTGRVYSAEARSNNSRAQATRTTCPDCGVSFTPSWMVRHKNIGRCA